MAEVRETQVTRDMEGNVVDRQTMIERPKKKGGFGWGMILGVLIIAAGIVAFAYSQGSFQSAGREADQATAEVQDQTSTVAQNAGNAIGNVTTQDSSQTPTQTSETTTN